MQHLADTGNQRESMVAERRESDPGELTGKTYEVRKPCAMSNMRALFLMNEQNWKNDQVRGGVGSNSRTSI